MDEHDFGVKLHKAAWNRESFAGIAQSEGPATIYSRDHIDLDPRFERDLLVRKEYEACFDYLQDRHKLHLASKTRSGRVIVTGQPGIGKSLFLVYALIQRLLEGQPTAIQYVPGEFLLFDEWGVRRFFDNGLARVQLGPQSWVLIDADVGVRLGTAISTSRAFVVVSSSTDPSLWKRWRKQTGARLWVMDIWPEDELRQLFEHCFPTMSERAMQLSKEYGPSPWAIVNIIEAAQDGDHRPTCEADRDVRIGVSRFVRDPVRTILTWDGLDSTGDVSSDVFFCRPALVPDDAGSRGRAEFVIPTPFLLHSLAIEVLAKPGAEQQALLEAMRDRAALRKPAEDLFATLAHAYFTSLTSPGSVLYCGNKAGGGGYIQPHLARDLIVGKPEAMGDATTGFYWPSDLAGIDAVLFDSYHVSYLQLTIAKTPKDVDVVQGVAAARAHLHPTVRERHASFVLVGIASADATAARDSLGGKTAALGIPLCCTALGLTAMPDLGLARKNLSKLMMLPD